MTHRTSSKIEYHAAPYGYIATIPAGTPCEPASNLPPTKDGSARYWVSQWDRMTPKASSWERGYGFLVQACEVESAP